MSKLVVEVCPESGMCSIVRNSAGKADLMPDEVAALREAGKDVEKIRTIIAASDTAFAASLSEKELRDIAADIS